MAIQRILHILCIFMLILTLSYAPKSWADKGGNGNGHGNKHHGKDKHDDDDDDYSYDNDAHHGRVIINNYDRVVIREYIVEEHHSHCPPGLAKKHNGCLPPGQAKKYHIGQPLPEVVVWEPVPQPLLVRLQPVPQGYEYVQVDNDVLLISEASHKVIDAITLLSAIGH